MRFKIGICGGMGLLIAVLLFEGCAEDHKEIEKKVLDYDASFQELIDYRDSIQKESDEQKVSYNQKKEEIENQIDGHKGQINALNEKKSDLKTEHLESLEKIKRQIYPKTLSLKQDLVEMQRLLKRKKIEIRDVNKDIDEINSLVSKKERLSLSREEIQAWNNRFSSLVEQKSVIEKEIDSLKTEIKITRLKIKVLEIK